MLSCTQPVDISIDFGEPQLVLNSILDATKDSIGVTLSLSHSITSVESFQKVNDAVVELYEDQQLVGQFAFTDSGVYVLNYRPFVGKEYEIVARTGGKTVKGRTRIPEAVSFELEKIDDEYDDFKLTMNGNDIDSANVWISVLSTHFFVSDTLEKVPRHSIYSSSTFLDPFNRGEDTYKQYAYSYEYYLLLSGYENKESVEIFFGLEADVRSNEIIVSVFDDNLSSYVKSSIMATDVENTMGDYPFYIDPVEVYSNIEGGIGIVGSMNSNSKEILNRLIFH